MRITMTKAEALAKQAEHVAWYASKYPWGSLADKVASMTTADKLEDDVQYDIVTINEHIPRGHDIERLCGIADHGD